ncbi:MAG: Hpt domain-containing protein [Treponemataceae bacterium]|nr:Hpt domain-containing protein [Treponemataceae bacterium]
MNIDILKNAGIDYDSGYERFSGLDAVYQKFLRMFPEDPSYNETVEAIKNNNIEKAFSSAHTLKGTAGNLSLTELYHASSLLVEDLRVKRTENLTKLLDNVTKAYEQAIKAIKEASADE